MGGGEISSNTFWRLTHNAIYKLVIKSLSLIDLRIPPANRLEKLGGNRAGQYSIRINDQWRICFEWRDGDVFDVEITDYH